MKPATLLQRFPVGRKVRVREGMRWLSGVVEGNDSQTVDVRLGEAVRVSVHISVAGRHLRVDKGL